MYLVLDIIDREIKMWGKWENISIANLNEFIFYMHFFIVDPIFYM